MSWWQLLSIMQGQSEEYQAYVSMGPQACPRCGEPLTLTPFSSEGERFCRYDGWQFPRDWVRPDTP